MIHYLIQFFTTTLTVPKVKDMIYIPKQKYESMYNVIATHDLPREFKEPEAMKMELKSFLKTQMREENEEKEEKEKNHEKIGVSNISDLISSTNSYSFINN